MSAIAFEKKQLPDGSDNPKYIDLLDEVLLIALTAAATFSILDTYVPSMAVSARSGAGFGIGANLVGFPRL